MKGYIISDRGITEFKPSTLKNELLEFIGKHGVFSVNNLPLHIPKGTTIGTHSGIILPQLIPEDIILKSAIIVGPSKVEEYEQAFKKTTNP